MGAIVYIVCSGEHGEAHSPIAVYDAYIRAVAHVFRAVPQPDVFVEKDNGRWLMTVDGVDEWWIYRMPVDSMMIVPFSTGKPRRHWIKPRGICCRCGKEKALCADGTLVNHEGAKGPRSDRWPRGAPGLDCAGSHLPPKRVVS